MPVEVLSKRWNIHAPNPQLQVELSNVLKVHPIVAQILINRQIMDIEGARSFLKADLSQLHDPFLLKDMDLAVGRIKRAGENSETVLIFGDYDVDGVTSSALLHLALKELGLKVLNYIPHRMNEGYGLNSGVSDHALQNNVTLIIAVDCGINAFEPVRHLKEKNIDVVIIDHHEPSAKGVPEAVAVINPKRVDCLYPFKGLASVGLVAKLIQALNGRFPEEHLDLIAIGTIADVAQLRGENRIFVKTGLPRISKTKNKGLLALMDVAGIKGKPFRPYFVGFILGPRINATGRMDSAHVSLDLLLCEDMERAYEIARSLETHNTQRQSLQKAVLQEAMALVESEINFKDHRIIVLHKEGWHKGVLGIVASRIVEKYYRPTIVLALEDGVAVGSGRSIEGFHLFEALTHCADHLETYGGHKMAAGLTVLGEKIENFRDMINDFARRTLESFDLVPSMELDGEISLSELTLDLVEIVESLAPFGEGNPAPVFCSRGLTVKIPAVIQGKDTLKFWVTDGNVVVQAVGFGMGKYRDMVNLGNKIDAAYQLSIDDWNKDPIVTLKLKDIKESEPGGGIRL